MKILIIILLTLIIVFFIMSFTAKAPSNIGVKDGKLAPAPHSPNCVSSFATTTDNEHYITPKPFEKPLDEQMTAIKATLETWPRTKLISESHNYLHYECTSLLFRFVDDLEIYLDEEGKKIHFRSASRVGHSDFGVNRKRVEKLKEAL